MAEEKANLQNTALRESIFPQSEAPPQVLSAAKDKMLALPDQLFYSKQIPVCLWFLAKSKAAVANLDEYSNKGHHTGTASRVFDFHLN